MTQVLTNLVTNAIQYTTRGGNIVISTGEEKGQDHTWATVTVTDTGMGIAREELPHIFERFFRGERPRSMQVPGTGLGLSIVKDIVELHGGQVTVESKIDVGTTFTIWLPPMNSNAR
jgi:signal transduction histidine kinase